MEQLNSLISNDDIDNYLSGKNPGRIDKIEESLKEIVLVNPISLKKLLKRLLKNNQANNQSIAHAVHKLGEAYWSCFQDELETKHINDIILDDNYSTDLKKTFDIQNGKFRTVQGIANKIGRSREDVGELVKKIGIEKIDGAYLNENVILIRDLFDHYPNQKERIKAGLVSKKPNSLSYISKADLNILKSKKLKKLNKKTGIFD